MKLLESSDGKEQALTFTKAEAKELQKIAEAASAILGKQSNAYKKAKWLSDNIPAF